MRLRRSLRWIAAALLAACGGSESADPGDLRADLQISRVRLDLMARPGAKLIAEIRNAGASPARGFGCRCTWVCPGRSLFSSEIRIADDASVGPAETGSFSTDAAPYRFGCAGSPPVIELTCDVDDRGAVEELDEHNNQWKGPVRLNY